MEIITPALFSPSLRSSFRRLLHLAPPFLVEDYQPKAVQAHHSGWLKHRAAEALEELHSCKICPRDCGVNRLDNKKGLCNTGRLAMVSSAFPHFGEESVLQGWRGSGTIFFGMCNLRCVFCQNWDISQKKNGWELNKHEIADLMLKLQNETKYLSKWYFGMGRLNSQHDLCVGVTTSILSLRSTWCLRS